MDHLCPLIHSGKGSMAAFYMAFLFPTLQELGEGRGQFSMETSEGGTISSLMQALRTPQKKTYGGIKKGDEEKLSIASEEATSVLDQVKNLIL